MASKKPFYLNPMLHYYLVAGFLEGRAGKLLDIGSGNAEFVGNLSIDGRSKIKTYGFDVDKENVLRARKKFPKVAFKYAPVGNKLPYPDNSFDFVSLFHVLEHVDNEKRALSEVTRVLKRGGTLFLASPYKGMFTWADTANLRFRFPRLHAAFFRLFVGEEEYLRRFNKRATTRLYGDCSSNRTWHKHYKLSDLEKLLNGSFEIYKVYRFSVFHPFLLVLLNTVDYLFGSKPAWIKYLIWLDNHLFAGNLSYNFLLVARKK